MLSYSLAEAIHSSYQQQGSVIPVALCRGKLYWKSPPVTTEFAAASDEETHLYAYADIC